MAIEQTISEFEAKKQMIDIGKRVWQKGWVAANDGNFTYRLNEREILCTPTGTSKSMLTLENICKVDIDGNVLEARGGFKPSSEYKIHIIVMKKRPDIRSVIHTHPPYATAHAIAGIPLTDCVIPEAIVGLGSVPIAPYGTPSTNELPDRLEPLLKDYNAWLLENHGTLAGGKDPYEAYFRTESVELFAQMRYLAHTLGNINYLNNDNVSKLHSTFNITGRGTNVCSNPSCGTSPQPEGAAPYGAPSYANQPDNSSDDYEKIVEMVTKRVREALGK